MYIAIVNKQTNEIEGLAPNESQARTLLRRLPTYYCGKPCTITFSAGDRVITGSDANDTIISEFTEIVEPEQPDEAVPPQNNEVKA